MTILLLKILYQKEPSSSPVSQPLADNSAKRTKVTAYSTMDQDIIIPPD